MSGAAVAGRRVAVIYAGGTIGMVPSADGLVPDRSLPQRLRATLAGREDLPSFDFVGDFAPIDSAEARPSDWSAMAGVIAGLGDWDGVVVLHGTDTLAFTASALSFLLPDGGAPRRVVVTGSQLPLGVAGSDAGANVADSLLAAALGPQEVMVAFHGRLLRGNRTVKRSSRDLDAFASPNAPPILAVVSAEALARLPPPVLPYPVEGDVRDPPGAYTMQVTFDWTLPRCRDGAVATLRLVPGFDPGLVPLVLADRGDGRPGALLVECYASGTAPTADGRLAAALAEATAEGIVVAAVSQAGHGGVALGTYAAGSALARAGVISGGDMTFECAFAKLHVLLARGMRPDAVRDHFARPLRGEMSAG